MKRRIGIFALMAVDVITIDYYKADCFIIVVLAIVDGIVKNAFRFKININAEWILFRISLQQFKVLQILRNRH